MFGSLHSCSAQVLITSRLISRKATAPGLIFVVLEAASRTVTSFFRLFFFVERLAALSLTW